MQGRRQGLSCFIIARNEADRIGRAIESVRGLADEVIVVDSGSTDNTQMVAAGLGAKVIAHDWAGYGPQKRFAEDQCSHDWLLNLDADEWLSDELREEIRALMGALPAPPADSFKMKVTIVYPEREKPAPFADSTICLRLYDRRVTRFSDSPVFDNVRETPQTLMLRAPIYHKSFRKLADVVRKELAYFELQGKTLRKSRAQLLARLPVEFPWQFFRFWILNRHIFGGWYGFAVANVTAFMRFMRIVIMLKW
ncbi:MAG: glycosyltransferase family 2 protein [Beijerinckiaceae bacterium]